MTRTLGLRSFHTNSPRPSRLRLASTVGHASQDGASMRQQAVPATDRTAPAVAASTGTKPAVPQLNHERWRQLARSRQQGTRLGVKNVITKVIPSGDEDQLRDPVDEPLAPPHPQQPVIPPASGPPPADRFDPEWKHYSVTLENDDCTAELTRKGNVFGATVHKIGTVAHWTLVIERLPVGTYLALGVLDTDKVSRKEKAPATPSTAEGAYLWRTFGWRAGGKGPADTVVDGIANPAPYDGWREGDTVDITLDTNALEATMCVKRVGVVRRVKVEPSRKGWRLMVHLRAYKGGPARVRLVA